MNNDRNIKELERFAQEEYHDLEKEQRQVRLLALGIMGAVIAFAFRLPELRFTEDGSTLIDLDNLMRVILSGLSFVYFLLAVNFVRLSRRYENITVFLRRIRPDEYKAFFSETKKDSLALRDYIPTLSNFMIFVFPIVLSLFSAFFFFPSEWQRYAVIICIAFVIADIIISASLMSLWLSGPKGKVAGIGVGMGAIDVWLGLRSC